MTLTLIQLEIDKLNLNKHGDIIMNKFLILLGSTMLVLLALAMSGCGKTDTVEETAILGKRYYTEHYI